MRRTKCLRYFRQFFGLCKYRRHFISPRGCFGRRPALFIVVYFVRLFDRGYDIVVFEPYNSVFNSIARNLM